MHGNSMCGTICGGDNSWLLEEFVKHSSWGDVWLRTGVTGCCCTLGGVISWGQVGESGGTGICATLETGATGDRNGLCLKGVTLLGFGEEWSTLGGGVVGVRIDGWACLTGAAADYWMGKDIRSYVNLSLFMTCATWKKDLFIASPLKIVGRLLFFRFCKMWPISLTTFLMVSMHE